jgi:UDP-N-acetylglucosamine 2-epimerase (non-hydrolysing)
MKIMTVLGTRPEIIRLSGVIAILDKSSQHVLVHTGQNYDDGLSGLFFRELCVREPDVYMGVRAESFAEQIGQILEYSHRVFLEYLPDRVLILGDTDSGLVAIVARRLGIPVYHMEAGNRCFDDRVPEEVNRRIIDHSSTVLMPYTYRSKDNLIAEGIAPSRICVIGNPIYEVMTRYSFQIASSRALEATGVKPRNFFLVTMHRSENVDRKDRLHGIITALEELHRVFGYPVIVSVHPRTASKIRNFGIDLQSDGLTFLSPLGLFDFMKLEQNAFCVITDSGTVQEEACIQRVPNVTIREVTERPETVECGSNILAGVEAQTILDAVRLATSRDCSWSPPAEYLRPDVSATACNIIMGYRQPDAAELEWRQFPARSSVAKQCV